MLYGWHHTYLWFDKPCNGSHSAGLWEADIAMPDDSSPDFPGNDWVGDPYYGIGESPLFVPNSDRNNDRDFERALCACVMARVASRKDHASGFYTCDSWANDMWPCATKSIDKKPGPGATKARERGLPGAGMHLED